MAFRSCASRRGPLFALLCTTNGRCGVHCLLMEVGREWGRKQEQREGGGAVPRLDIVAEQFFSASLAVCVKDNDVDLIPYILILSFFSLRLVSGLLIQLSLTATMEVKSCTFF